MLDAQLTDAVPQGSADAAAPQMARRLFWDGSGLDLLSCFEAYLDNDDKANAAACFGRLARFRYRELANQLDFDPARKSIITAFQAKSGGTFLHNRLLQIGYKEFWWCFSARRCASLCYASDEALRYYLLGGCACHTHARPDPNILAALDRAAVDKIWVHLRNPAATVVSTYHHFLGQGHGEGAIGEQRAKEAIDFARQHDLHVDAGKDAFVMEHIDWHVEWTASWLRFAQDRPGLVVFSFYCELADLHAMLARVFAELGADMRGNVSAAVSGNDRYRRKEEKNWRAGLSAEAIALLEERVRTGLADYPEFERLWT